jgi:hypothetical protein
LSRPLLFLGIGLVAIPVSILVAVLDSGLLRVGSFAGFDTSGESGGYRVSIAVLVGTILTFLGIAVIHAATIRAVTEIDAGREINIRRALRLAVDRPRPLVGAVAIAVASVVLLSLSVFLVPIAIWLVIRWALLIPVAELESGTAVATLRRSNSLVGRQPIKIAWLTVVTALIAIATGPILGTLLILGSDAPLEIINVVAGVTYAFLIPFTGLTAAYVYNDTRVRERLDGGASSAKELPAEV